MTSGLVGGWAHRWRAFIFEIAPTRRNSDEFKAF
jgi:hypothetical protein